MKARRPTIDDVARLAGVSIKTVSRVFNQEPNVRLATQKKVRAAAAKLDYRPNLSARRLASNQTYMVGMLYDNPNSEYVTEVQTGVLGACQANGYNLLISPCRSGSSDLIDEVTAIRRQVDGFVVLQPLSDLPELNRLLLDNSIPCARVSQRPLEGFPWISVGDADAAEEMTEHLLRLGHRRIGFVVGHPDHGQSHDRLAGYHRVLERHGIELDNELVQQGYFDFSSGSKCGRALLSLENRPTAIFASNDAMAAGVLSVAHELGLSVPGQLSVAGFDDTPTARHTWPPLTTVRQPIAEVARLATEELLKILQGRAESAANHCLGADLVIRDSTASPALRRAAP